MGVMEMKVGPRQLAALRNPAPGNFGLKVQLLNGMTERKVTYAPGVKPEDVKAAIDQLASDARMGELAQQVRDRLWPKPAEQPPAEQPAAPPPANPADEFSSPSLVAEVKEVGEMVAAGEIKGSEKENPVPSMGAVVRAGIIDEKIAFKKYVLVGEEDAVFSTPDPEVDVAGFTHVGRTHYMETKVNQDGLGVYYDPAAKETTLLASDGAGGHSAGEVASAAALINAITMLRAGKIIDPAAVAFIAADIRLMGQRIADFAGMLATFTAVRINGNRASIIHSGDTLVFRTRLSGETELLTFPHWRVKDQAIKLESEIRTPEENPDPGRLVLSRKTPPFPQADIVKILERQTNQLYSALGLEAPALQETSATLEPGDRVWIVCDGVLAAFKGHFADIVKIIANQEKPTTEVLAELKMEAISRQAAADRGDDLTALIYENTEVVVTDSMAMDLAAEAAPAPQAPEETVIHHPGADKPITEEEIASKPAEAAASPETRLEEMKRRLLGINPSLVANQSAAQATLDQQSKILGAMRLELDARLAEIDAEIASVGEAAERQIAILKHEKNEGLSGRKTLAEAKLREIWGGIDKDHLERRLRAIETEDPLLSDIQRRYDNMILKATQDAAERVMQLEEIKTGLKTTYDPTLAEQQKVVDDAGLAAVRVKTDADARSKYISEIDALRERLNVLSGEVEDLTQRYK